MNYFITNKLFASLSEFKKISFKMLGTRNSGCYADAPFFLAPLERTGLGDPLGP